MLCAADLHLLYFRHYAALDYRTLLLQYCYYLFAKAFVWSTVELVDIATPRFNTGGGCCCSVCCCSISTYSNSLVCFVCMCNGLTSLR